MLRKERIQNLISNELSPSFISVEDESGNHHVPVGAQTHFKLIVVCAQFEGVSRVARHRLINQLLCDEFNQGLHALSMHLYTEAEWELKSDGVLKSPSCRDGFGQ